MNFIKKGDVPEFLKVGGNNRKWFLFIFKVISAEIQVFFKISSLLECIEENKGLKLMSKIFKLGLNIFRQVIVNINKALSLAVVY